MDNKVEALYDFQLNLIKPVNDKFYRSAFNSINWDARMIGLKGPRGAGKTTLLLQRLKYHTHKALNPLFVTMEHPVFYTPGALFETVEEFYKFGGRYLYIDEIHKYNNWSRELKVIYDGFPELKLVFTASSALEIFQGESDLSRRVLSEYLPGMSFREYLKLIHGIDFPVVCLSEIIENHRQISTDISLKIQILPLFNQYLKEGYLPVISGIKSEDYQIQLIQIINTVLIQDLQLSKNLTPGAIAKLKSLLGIIAESAPFEPNISAIAAKSGIRRETVYEFLDYLEQAKIINSVRKAPKGITALQKPNKIYLENTNLSFALKTLPNSGTLRETFFLNQLRNAGHNVSLPEELHDFYVDGSLTFEIGGKNKTVNDKTIWIAADNIETGWAKTIPLWLFGFLY